MPALSIARLEKLPRNAFGKILLAALPAAGAGVLVNHLIDGWVASLVVGATTCAVVYVLFIMVLRPHPEDVRALAAAGCDVVVCDDGLQHYALRRDVEIEVIDGRRRYGNGHVLPAGPLREPVERGARCDFRVVNLPPGESADAQTGFGEWPMRLSGESAVPVLRGRAQPLTSFAGQRVHAVAGIGDPERFFAMLRALGIAVVPHAFSDHHRYVAGDFQFGSELPLLMTEKDAVKCERFADRRFWSRPVEADAVLALLTREPLVLTNVPRLNDVRTMQTLLAQMGVDLAQGLDRLVKLRDGPGRGVSAPWHACLLGQQDLDFGRGALLAGNQLDAARAARPRLSRALIVPSGTPTSRATSWTERSAMWCSTSAWRWDSGS